MKDEFTNRLGAFRTTFDFLQAPANKPKWEGLPPLRFTSRVAEAGAAVAALAEYCQQQGAVIKGSAQDKAREEKELEDVAFVLGQAVAECCDGMGNEADAARCAFSRSTWRGMRDAALLANAREVIRVAEGLLAGPHADVAAECGITAVSVAACKKKADDYEAVISAPQQSIATRKALTAELRALQCGGKGLHQPRRSGGAVHRQDLRGRLPRRPHRARFGPRPSSGNDSSCAAALN